MNRYNECRQETGTARDALAPYPWSGSVNWCLGAKETEISAALWALQLEKNFTFTVLRIHAVHTLLVNTGIHHKFAKRYAGCKIHHHILLPK